MWGPFFPPPPAWSARFLPGRTNDIQVTTSSSGTALPFRLDPRAIVILRRS